MAKHKDNSILIASGVPSTRKALYIYLDEQNGLNVVAEAQDSHELLKKIESTCPSIVLLDWDLLDRATPLLINTIKSLAIKPLVIVLSPDSEHRQEALDARADAFVDTSKPPKELLGVILNSFEQ